MSEESKAEKAESKKGKNTVEKSEVKTASSEPCVREFKRLDDEESSDSEFTFEMKGESGGFSKEFLMPYSFHIKNLTDEKLYDVDLFNYDHEKQNKVAYSCTNGVDYNMFLRFLSSLNEPTEGVNLLRLVAVCDYQKFKAKQLRSCISVIYQEPKGRMISTPIQSGIHLSAYQQQSDIIEIPLKDSNKIKLFNQLQLRFSYLMPEAEMHISIFPKKINK